MATKKMAVLAIFTVIALTIFVIENAIPIPIPLPGIKLGLANIITLIVLLNYKSGDAFLVLVCRILLGTMFTGQAVSLLYSFSGGILCLLIMILLNRILHGHFIVLISVFGGLFHNIGQITAAFLITNTLGVFSYFPFLAISGIITGFFTGFCAFFAQKYLMAHKKWL